MQTHESILQGILPWSDLPAVLLSLETLSAPHLTATYFYTQETEYYSKLSRYNLMVKVETLMETNSKLNISFPSTNIIHNLLNGDLQRSTIMYQEGRTKSSNRIVRSRVQSIIHGGDAPAFVARLGYSARQSWRLVGVRMELLSGVSVALMCPAAEVELSSTTDESAEAAAAARASIAGMCLVEISCRSSDANVDLAHERTANVATAIARHLILPDH